MNIFILPANLLINLARDLIFIILYVHTIDLKRTYSWQRNALALGVLILLNYLVIYADYYLDLINCSAGMLDIKYAVFALIRNAIRYISYFGYIFILTKLPIKVMVYDALLISSICLTCHNIFLTPMTKPFYYGTVILVNDPLINHIICLLFLNIASILIYILVYKFIPLNNISTLDNFRIVLMFLLLMMSIYFNITIKFFELIENTFVEQISHYIIILQILFLVCIAYFEYYHSSIQEKNRTALEKQAAYSLLEEIKNQEKNDIQLRHIRHDLHNHLTSIRHLIRSEEYKKAIEYIEGLSSEFVAAQPTIKTGNIIIDGIFIQKLSCAQEYNIPVSISADFSYTRHVDNADLCIIFGNLLDNALEACLNMAEPYRFINIRGRRLGETVIYIIENSFHGNIEFCSGIPLTSKPEKQLHGLGIKSVQRTLEKYSGTITFSGKDNIFSAVCSFPLPLDFSS